MAGSRQESRVRKYLGSDGASKATGRLRWIPSGKSSSHEEGQFALDKASMSEET
jgi:hypothetical protein